VKREAMGKIVNALREILNGRRYVSGVISKRMNEKSEHGEEPCGANRVRELTERELEVLELIRKGT
jgi:DNA-binding NarL/FixJ family response regulator